MPRVIVIGGANVDIKGRSSGAFIGGTSNPGEVTVSVGGVGRNIAESLARLGVETSLVTVLGNDANGRLVREQTESAGGDLSMVVTAKAATGTYLVILDKRGELMSALNDMQAIESLKPSDLDARSAKLSQADMLVADCNISADCLSWLCSFSVTHGIRLLIEPVSVPKAKKLLGLKRSAPIFAITPNRQQLLALTGEKDEQAALPKLHALGFSNIVVHLGAEGALASDGDQISHVEAYPVDDIADVTGAGDAAVAGLVRGLLDGLALPEAARMGQSAASLKLRSRESVAADLSHDKVRTLAGLT